MMTNKSNRFAALCVAARDCLRACAACRNWSVHECCHEFESNPSPAFAAGATLPSARSRRTQRGPAIHVVNIRSGTTALQCSRSDGALPPGLQRDVPFAHSPKQVCLLTLQVAASEKGQLSATTPLCPGSLRYLPAGLQARKSTCCENATCVDVMAGCFRSAHTFSCFSTPSCILYAPISGTDSRTLRRWHARPGRCAHGMSCWPHDSHRLHTPRHRQRWHSAQMCKAHRVLGCRRRPRTPS